MDAWRSLDTCYIFSWFSVIISNCTVFSPIFNSTLITLYNILACDLESHTTGMKYCFGVQQPHVWCCLKWQTWLLFIHSVHKVSICKVFHQHWAYFIHMFLSFCFFPNSPVLRWSWLKATSLWLFQVNHTFYKHDMNILAVNNEISWVHCSLLPILSSTEGLCKQKLKLF